MTDHAHAAAQCHDQLVPGNGAALQCVGAGVWPLLALGTHELLPSSATLLPAADIPHHIISVLQTMNNYLPSRLSSPGSTLAGAGARYSGQLMLSFYYLTFRQK